ncbi:Glycosyl transferase, group 1 [hydrothermal vent metagenome]|uniref:Glycosyl transferase, group 1 n=1 Tax=hydrothermal vent metagenome TaxID=652676 RepID=A0A3B1DIU0_9ZZZZ
MKILFLTTGKDAPSYRFRIGQMLPFFEQKGHVCQVAHFPKQIWSRVILFHQLDSYDAIVLQRHLLNPFELSLLRKRTTHLFYDIDDAVMFNSKGESRWKRTGRFLNTMQAVDMVLCGNDYLAEQASQSGTATKIIPTAVPVNMIKEFAGTTRKHLSNKVIIGWTGSRSTCRYLNDLLPVLATFGQQIHLKIISNAKKSFHNKQLGNVTCEHIEWSKKTEYRALADVQIGLMPLPDNAWTRGKCGFKALQYMALSIPTICSPVGMNCQLIDHKKNGFLAQSTTEWRTALQSLIQSETLRKTIGQAGYSTVMQQYNLEIIGPLLVQTIEEAVQPNVLSKVA